jgi:hypothetical protein
MAADGFKVPTQEDPDVLREVIESRTEYSKTFIMKNGRTKVYYSEAPIHYWDESDQQWQPIEISFTPNQP